MVSLEEGDGEALPSLHGKAPCAAGEDADDEAADPVQNFDENPKSTPTELRRLLKMVTFVKVLFYIMTAFQILLFMDLLKSRSLIGLSSSFSRHCSSF